MTLATEPDTNPTRDFLPLGLGAGLLGAALNAFVHVPLYPGVDLVFGSIPVLAIAMCAGWRAAWVAAAIAGLPTMGLWGHPLAWATYMVEAIAVALWGRRLHPAILVAGFWLVLGLPAYALLGAATRGAFASNLPVIAIKTPFQEIFATLVALDLLFLSAVRAPMRKRWPWLRLPIVSLTSFQLSYMGLLLLAVTGTVLIVEGHHIYDEQRALMVVGDRVASVAIAEKTEAFLHGYSNTMQVSGALWGNLTDAQQGASVRHLLLRGRFDAFLWLGPDFRVRQGWALGPGGQIVSLPAGQLHSSLIPLGHLVGSRHVGIEFERLGLPNQPSVLAVMAPVEGRPGEHLIGGVDLRTLEATLQGEAITPNMGLQLIDAAGRPILSTTAIYGPPRLANWAGRFPGGIAGTGDLTAQARIEGTSWRVRVVTPAWVLSERVNANLRAAVPSLILLLLLMGALGAGLMVVLGRELARLTLATRHLGDHEPSETSQSDSFLREIQELYRTYHAVDTSLHETLKALRTRDAELTLANGQLAATVDELRTLDRNRTEVLNTISHDIKIPLTAVTGYAELLEDEAGGELSALQHGFVTGIDENSKRVIHLLDDLLDMARLEVGRFPIDAVAVDLGELLAGTRRNLQPLIERARLEVSLDVPANLPAVFADPARLEQILNNLVSNAIKFTPAGGTVTLSAHGDPQGQQAVIQVSDTGVGIAPENLPHLFERFYRVEGTQAAGTGLGLAIAKKLVEAMGGKIGVVSDERRGSTFWFTLPWAVAEAASARGRAARHQVP